jgi:hypothetical protein
MASKDDVDDEGFAALKDVEEEDTDDANKQLVLHADFDDSSSEDDEDFAPAADEDDEDEEDFAPEEDESADEDLEEEAIDGEGDDTPSHPEQKQTEEAGDDDEETLAGFDEAARTKIRKLHSAFPGASLAVCRHVYDQAEGKSMIISWEALDKGFKAVKPKSAFAETLQEGASTKSPKSKKRPAEDFEDDDEMEVDEDEEESQDPFLNYYDQNGLPPGSITSGRALLVMAEAVKGSPNRRPQSKVSITSKKSIKFAVDEELSKGLTSTPLLDQESHEDESGVDSDDSSEETSSSGSGSSDSSDEESDNVEVENEGTSSSGSDSDSDSSSEDESTNEVLNMTIDAVASKSSNVEAEDTSSSGSDSESESESESSSDSSSEDESPEEVSSKFVAALSALTETPQSSPAVTPGRGKKETRARNERRRKMNVLERYVKKGILPAGTTLKEFNHLKLNDDTSAEDAFTALQEVRSAMVAAESERSAGRALAKTDEFEQRRQKLLASLASGGVEVGQSSRNPSESPVIESQATAAENLSREASKELAFDPNEALIFSTAPEAIEQKSSTQNAPEDTSMETEDIRPSTVPESTDTPSELPRAQLASVDSCQVKASRRPKLDLSAGTRLLFGALGRRAPTNKQDAAKIQKDLMKDVRPTKAAKSTEEPVANASESDDDEAWREKIVYRAVECCYDGVKLSEPPFPFEQRWDPQQKTSWTPHGKDSNKQMKRVRDQSQYYDPAHPRKKHRNQRAKYSNAAERERNTDATYESSFQQDSINAQDEESQMSGIQNDDEGEINQQLINDLQPTSAEVSQVPDDLVALPEDPSFLPQLENGKAKVGMTIAFKKLEMSAETGWQPQMSPYRTAIVVKIEENGDLDLRLAVRDRAQKSYDEQTGERTFAKFEMPVDDEEEEDDGRLYLSFGELVEPKIVAPPPANADQDSVMGEASQTKVGRSTVESVTLSHEREEKTVEAEFSHVTETPLHSDAPDAPERTEEIITEEVEQSIADPVTEDIAPAPKTPTNGGNIDEISSQNARTIKTIMKDAGFRSSVPTIVLDDLRPDGTETPGDAAVFEKLLKDMTEVGSRSYSPKFNGFGSSPSRKPQEQLKSPEESQNLAALGSSPPKKQSERPEIPEICEPSQRAPSDSPEPPPSSWQTIDSPEEPFTSPAKTYENTSSWVTMPEGASSPRPEPEVEASPEPEEKDPTPQPTPKKTPTPRKVSEKERTPRQTPKTAPTPKPEPQKAANPVPESAKPKSIKKIKRRTFGKAQELWDKFEPAKSASPAIESPNKSPDPFGLDGMDENDTSVQYHENETSVQYPKLSVGSSFTSQVTDNGRQPDFNFDDSTTVNVETPKMPGLDDDEGAATDVEPELPSHESIEEDLSVNQPDDSIAVEPKLPARKPAVEADVLEDDSEDLPSLDENFFSQKSVKEKTPVRSKASSKADKENKKAMATFEEESDDEVTPKASQKQRQASQSRQNHRQPLQGASQVNSIRPSIFQSRASQPSASQPNAPQPRASQPRTSASQPFMKPDTQVYDLTISSDAEPDSPVKTSKRPRKYDLNSDDDEDYQGWVPKKESFIKGVETRRHTSVGLRNSSQTSLNKNRRKTSAR